MMRVEGLTTAEQTEAAARSQLYRLLANGFAFPDRAFFAALGNGSYRREVEETAQALPYALDCTPDGLGASGQYVDFQAEYLRLFEAAMGMPPCPLYSGLYRGGRKAVMEELTRFYNFFGLSVEQGAGELPDHLTMELEFMHFLTFKELVAVHGGGDPAPYRRAQGDFLERQLTSWLPKLEERLERLSPPPFYAALASLTSALTHLEHAYVRELTSAVLEGT